jgi:hypothetical protein
MVPPYTLDIKEIVLSYLSVGHGVGTSFDTKEEAVEALIEHIKNISDRDKSEY